MRMPSAKTLMSTFRDLSKEQAHLVRSIGHAVDDAAALQRLIEAMIVDAPRTYRYVRSLHGNPYTSQMWRVTVALYAMDEVCDTHGVESLGEGAHSEGYAPPHEYLNVGDPYVATIVYSRAAHACRIACWGDIAERMPSETE